MESQCQRLGSPVGRVRGLLKELEGASQECMAVRVAGRINNFGVIETMADVMLECPGSAPMV